MSRFVFNDCSGCLGFDERAVMCIGWHQHFSSE